MNFKLPPLSPRRFDTTHWSVVQAAGGDASTEARHAMASLCATYWPPLYWYARRWSSDAETAQDLTQTFLTEFIEHDRVRAADRTRGRFRSFLLASFKHFLLNDAQARRTAKRGGGAPVLSLDFASAEGRYALEVPDTRTPDAIFDRRWAMTVLDLAMVRLTQEADEEGKRDEFLVLKPSLTGESENGGYAALGRALGRSEGAIKVAVHRLRRRYRDLVRDEIARTVATEQEIDEEVQYLLAALRR